MMKRGTKSAADLGDNVIPLGRSKPPEPPADLTERQSAIWQETVATESPEVFATGAMRAMLADYCRHRESAEVVSSIIRDFKAEWLRSDEGADRYYKLMKMRDLETRAATSLATKMRVTNQSRYSAKAAGTAARNMPQVAPPWER